MLPYETVKSIHEQRMAQFLREKEKDQLRRMARAGQPAAAERLAKALASIGEKLRSGRRPIQPAH